MNYEVVTNEIGQKYQMRPPGIKSLSHQPSLKSNFRESWDAKMLGLSKNTRDMGIKIR